MTAPTPAPLRHDSPARDTWVASITDPAFDRDSPAWPGARDRYARTRAIADLAALPTVPEQLPTLWRLRPLSAVARAGIYTHTSSALQRISAVRLGVVARIDGPRIYDGAAGLVREAAEAPLDAIEGAPLPQLRDAAIDAQTATHGGLWVDEIGEVVLHRTDLPPRRYLPFPLPLPSALL